MPVLRETPECMAVGEFCRYADRSGVVHDAFITDIVSALDGVVDLAYNNGDTEAHAVPYSRDPRPHRWGCALDGAPVSWGDIETVTKPNPGG